MLMHEENMISLYSYAFIYLYPLSKHTVSQQRRFDVAVASSVTLHNLCSVVQYAAECFFHPVLFQPLPLSGLNRR